MTRNTRDPVRDLHVVQEHDGWHVLVVRESRESRPYHRRMSVYSLGPFASSWEACGVAAVQ